MVPSADDDDYVAFLRRKTAILPLSTHNNCAKRWKSSSPSENVSEETGGDDLLIQERIKREIQRLRYIRNVGVFAHVDAGKTTVTERFLALAGVVRTAGSVDDGTTITDFLPAERERGITIQAAAVSFEWGWHNSNSGDDFSANDNVTISLIDTPGHIDFSVEVNRSVAVLDGAVLVVDAVAGVQAQTETVWRAMTRHLPNNHETETSASEMLAYDQQDHLHEPLPCLVVINKMDKEGSNYAHAIQSIQTKLPGAKPLPIQIPLFKSISGKSSISKLFSDSKMFAVAADEMSPEGGDFVGVIDLIHMRAIIWPENGCSSSIDDFVPQVTNLLDTNTHQPIDSDCPITHKSMRARKKLIEALADADEIIEEFYLNDSEPTNADVRLAVRRATLCHQALPVLAAAAVRGKGVEPLLDCVADLLPSPLDRIPPPLTVVTKNQQKTGQAPSLQQQQQGSSSPITLGHPLHPSMLALAFKVVHMKGRGGSGDGRVVFARVYSGEMKDRDVLHAISPPALGEAPTGYRVERVGGMLELEGGRFGSLKGGVCKSGGVCAVIGLKDVVTGDTLVSAPPPKKKKSTKDEQVVCLAGFASPKPVLTVRLEAETAESQARLSDALVLLAVEDPSLVIEETDTTTLLSGLGELHIEVTLDRLQREHGIHVVVGAPSVAYRETLTDAVETQGLVDYDRTFGATRLQGAIQLIIKPTWSTVATDTPCLMLADPVVTVGEKAREFLGVDASAREEDLMATSEVFNALVQGCQGALQRGPVGSYALSNVKCHVVDVDAEGGLAALQSMPGTLRAVAANAVSSVLSDGKKTCRLLEPTMSIEISLPSEHVGTVLSDLTSRRGQVGDVISGESTGGVSSKTLVRGEVPLVEILGYANTLRSLTAGEATFSAEYKGHSPC